MVGQLWFAVLSALPDDLNNLPHECTLTFSRTRCEFTLMQAVPGAVFSTCGSFREDWTIVQISEVISSDSQCAFAGVVEEE